MTGGRWRVFLFHISVVAAVFFRPVRSNCDSVISPEEKTPPPLPQYSQSCHGPFPVLVKVDLGVKFAGLETVMRTEPASLVVSRCSGYCVSGYQSLCRGTATTTRNVTVGVVYTEGACESTVIQVEDDLSCGCGCRQESHLSCPGLATFHKESCTCSCNTSSLATVCPPGKMFSSQECSCVCSSVSVSCWWPLTWDSQHCGCTLVLTT